MLLTLRGKDGEYHSVDLKYLLLSLLVLVVIGVLSLVGYAYTAQYQKIYDQTYAAIREKEVNILVPNGGLAKNAVLGCAFASPELFSVESVSYRTVRGGVEYYFTYNAYADDYEENLSVYEKMLDDVVKGAPWQGTEREKATWAHDYIIDNYSYGGSHRAYGMLCEGQGVCSAYTQLYMALAEKLGLPCHYVLSETMDHAWALVKVEGVWYHVDATWDDQAEDTHRFFMRSDAEMLADGHYGWIDLGESRHIVENIAFWLKKAVWVLLTLTVIFSLLPVLRVKFFLKKKEE